jgi:hypothetical protein
MIHNPKPWLALLTNTSRNLAQADVVRTQRELADYIFFIEFFLHQSLFAIRKIDESIGVDLALDHKTCRASEWEANPANLALIRRSPDPALETWYDLLAPARCSALTHKRIINLCIHARICSFSADKVDADHAGKTGIFVASDHTLHQGIAYIGLSEIKTIVDDAISVFEPQVAARAARSMRSGS